MLETYQTPSKVPTFSSDSLIFIFVEVGSGENLRNDVTIILMVKFHEGNQPKLLKIGLYLPKVCCDYIHICTRENKIQSS
jgi:hypothetical protein